MTCPSWKKKVVRDQITSQEGQGTPPPNPIFPTRCPWTPAFKELTPTSEGKYRQTLLTSNLDANLSTWVISERNPCFIWLWFPVRAGCSGPSDRGHPEDPDLGNMAVTRRAMGCYVGTRAEWT